MLQQVHVIVIFAALFLEVPPFREKTASQAMLLSLLKPNCHGTSNSNSNNNKTTREVKTHTHIYI